MRLEPKPSQLYENQLTCPALVRVAMAHSGLLWPRLQDIGARDRIRTCTGDALDVVSLLVGPREQNEMEPPAGDAPPGILYKRNPQVAA